LLCAAAGKGLAKAKAARGARALEEAIAAGMVKAKGRGKKMRREAGEWSLLPRARHMLTHAYRHMHGAQDAWSA
jgi:hypothetical protein